MSPDQLPIDLLVRISGTLDQINRTLGTLAATIGNPSRVLVSQAEAAKKLGVRKERISQLVKDGKIQLVETGGRPKISVDQIERLAASGDLAPKRRGRPRKKPVGSNLGSILDWRPMVN